MRRGVLIGVAVLAAVGIVLRWLHLGERSLWFDEGYTQWVASLSASELIRAIRFDYTPPLYFLLVSWWAYLFGDSEFALRAFSALCATLAIPIVADIAWRTTRRPGATLAATALFALSQIQIEWAQSARVYSASSLAFALCIWVLIRYLESARRIWLLAFSLAAAFLIYQHNVMWFFLAALNVGALLWPGPLSFRSRVLSMAAADAVVVLCFLPWLGGFFQQLRALQTAYFTEKPVFYDLTTLVVQQAGTDLDRLRSLAAAHLGIADPSHRLWRLPLFAATSALSALAVIFSRGNARRRLLALLVFGVGPMVFGYIYSNLRTSVWVEKTFIPCSTVLPVLVTAALAVAMRYLLRAATIATLALVTATAALPCLDYHSNPPREDWRGLARWAPQLGTRDTHMVFVGAGGEMLYRYYNARFGLPAARATGLPFNYYSTDPPIVMTRVLHSQDIAPLEQAMTHDDVKRIVLVQAYTKWADPNHLAQRCLDSSWRMVETKDFGKVSARLYERSSVLAQRHAAPVR